ncbi:MAG: hypothetical protein ACI9F2_001166 [Lysobacterales bacterium]|jgi:hypothetical protein
MINKLLLPILFLSVLIGRPSEAGEFSGYASIESRIFTQEPHFSPQHNQRVSSSFALQPEYYHRWDEKNQSITVVPFFRVDQDDKERTHVDIREFFWQKYTNDLELNIGVRKIYWGVTESQHLVDIINQTDTLENLDGEDKLGQPMVNLSLYQDWGILDFFIMPYFRERAFVGKRGRLRGGLLIDDDQVTYDSSAEESHVDWALRWSHVLGDFDIGLSHFSGTSRVPRLLLGTDNDGNAIYTPHYDLIEQTGFDLQYTKEGWLWKFEAIHRVGQGESYNAAVGGFEYTLYNIFGSGSDVGFLAEYNYDDRGENAPVSSEDDVFLGTRLTFNNEQSTDLLVGFVKDLDSNASSVFVETSRRLTDHWKAEIEVSVINGTETGDIGHDLRKDDTVLISLLYYF